MLKTILITGASGFVGANLARRLIKDGHRLCLLLRQESNTWRLDDIIEHVDVRRVSLLDYDGLSTLVKEIRPDWIFHLAVHGAYSWQTNWQEIIDTNVSSTINLLEACSQTGFEALVNTGSSSEYGFSDHAPRESEPIEPNSYYAITKAAATMACRQVASAKGLYIPTLRLYSVYGPYEDPKRLMPTMIGRCLIGELPPLVDPDIARDFVYVDDIIEAYLAATTKKSNESGPIYNVGSGTQTSIADIVSVAKKLFGIKCEPDWGSMENRKWDSSIWVADIEKIKSELGWQPQIPIETGLECFASWIKSTEAVKSRYEYTTVDTLN